MARDIYQELGVRPLVNGAATQTSLGGSIMNPKVVAAMAEASRRFVDLYELQRAVDQRIAKLTRNEDAIVTSGATSAMYLSIAGLLKLKDPALFSVLPEDIPRTHRVIALRYQYSPFSCALQQAGIRLVEIGPPQKLYGGEVLDLSSELEQGALAVIYIPRGEYLMPEGKAVYDGIVRVCRERGVALIVDGAAQLPPRDNLWNFTSSGATAAIFSGGKDLRGPSSTGLMVGDKALMEACRQIISPNHGIGRLFKVDKEEMVGLMVAVEEYVAMDQDARLAWCEKQVEKLIRGLSSNRKLKVERAFPNEAGQPVPRALITFDSREVGKSPDEVLSELKDGEPSIVMHPAKGSALYCNPMTLQEGETDLIIEALRKVFR